MLDTHAPSRSVGRQLLPALLLLLTVFGPISMDVYLPALPSLTVDLGAATSVAQLTVTACLIGLAVGQLVAGPVSDQFGRRGILLVGLGAYIVTSVLCAISPTVELLIVARLVQGLCGGVGIVIAQAAGRDVYSGGQLIRFYGRLTVTGALAAIIGPMLGGVLTRVTDWRGVFLFLAVIGVGIFTVTVLMFSETLPVEQRVSGGLAQSLRDFRGLLADRVFLGAVLNQGFLWGAVFAYLAGATYVLQDIYGLSPQWYAAAFGLNSAGFALFGWLSGRSAERWSVTGTLAVGVVVAGIGAAGLLTCGLATMPLWVVIVSLFLLAGGVPISTPPATTLALAEYPQMAGTASSVLGTVRYGFGGVAAPLVGLAGAASILPLGVVTLTAVLLSAVVCLLLTSRYREASGAAAATPEPAQQVP
jgi:DHA1 family bicyclomycin/chloramphenicol resistance-like MFS transporter